MPARDTTLIRVPKSIVKEWDWLFPGRQKKQIVVMLNDVFKIVTKNGQYVKKKKRSNA